MATPCTNCYTHHLNRLTLQYSQNEISNGHLLNKNTTTFLFDTKCIQEVDNFKIYKDIHTNQNEYTDTIQYDFEINIDDIGCFSSGFATHIQILDVILTSL